MPVDWELEARRLAALARLRLTPEEVRELAAACDAITREFAALAEHARALPPAPEPEPGALREDAVAPAPPDEVDAILAAAPHVDAATRGVRVGRGIP
ncbi:MAG TPA: Asp-tRNA(Asn)/Glu-tRNA(Gln) amidotransferase GatCAB subunit C [Candidatus Thermoplasmatota archaeon]|nr:Asp-tRNA(Asn)/Glu-tRNA(Gln) amidotransferase GatCAB subunit C [Candidatus Thermoplasmatota archaeon]